MKSLGMVEVKSLTASLDAVDIMCKASNVEFVTWERKLGGKFVTVIVEGDIAAVQASVEAAMEKCIVKPAAHAVIANPHHETVKIVGASALRNAIFKREIYKKQLRQQQQMMAQEPKTSLNGKVGSR
jgi:ethanolamine utilization protein EutM